MFFYFQFFFTSTNFLTCNCSFTSSFIFNFHKPFFTANIFVYFHKPFFTLICGTYISAVFIPNLPHSYGFHATPSFLMWWSTLSVLVGNLNFLPMHHLQKSLFHQHNGRAHTHTKSFKRYAHSLTYFCLYVMESNNLQMYHYVVEKSRPTNYY